MMPGSLSVCNFPHCSEILCLVVIDMSRRYWLSFVPTSVYRLTHRNVLIFRNSCFFFFQIPFWLYEVAFSQPDNNSLPTYHRCLPSERKAHSGEDLQSFSFTTLLYRLNILLCIYGNPSFGRRSAVSQETEASAELKGRTPKNSLLHPHSQLGPLNRKFGLWFCSVNSKPHSPCMP
jgi:hypothetical protein